MKTKDTTPRPTAWREYRFVLTSAAKRLTPLPLSVPLELIGFCGPNTKKTRHSRCSGAAPGRCSPVLCTCFAEQNRQKREGSRGFLRFLRFCLCVWGFREN